MRYYCQHNYCYLKENNHNGDLLLVIQPERHKNRHLRINVLLIVLVSIGMVLTQVASSQDLSNLRTKTLVSISDTILLDSLSIIPNSLIVMAKDGFALDSSSYTVNFSEAILTWHISKEERPTELKLVYRIFPYALSKDYSHKNIDRVTPDKEGLSNPFVYSYKSNSNDIFALGGLSKSGSISRGISFGNSQDVIVNSSLDLRLSGRLSDNVNILAAITDDNVPIQPEGNTQQIQEFDKVFIQLHNEKTKLIAGDFEIGRPPGYFMNFYKKAQGASFSTLDVKEFPDGKETREMHLTSSVAISKGKFSKNVFNGTEGNQGPYKLTGSENEAFIIIISGTERVFIDGQLLTRGQEHDYIIDYNTAEITFTPAQLITKDKRISVEFQYSDRNYTRSLVHVGTGYKRNKLSLNLNIYTEQDAKNQPIDQDLTDDQKLLLSNIGDNLDSALSQRVDSVGFSDVGVLYKKFDSLGYEVYEYSADSGVYAVSFSNVGVGNGNYVQDINTVANGRVYKWVAPDSNGVPQGTHEPIVLLVTPKKRQMATIGGKYTFSKNTSATFEVAVSNNDINTFSTKDSDDDVGYAYQFNLENKINLSKTKKDPWVLTSNLSYEQVDKNFTIIERYRAVEFQRNWNLVSTSRVHEYIPGLSLSLSNKKTGLVQYRFNSFIRGNEYSAYRNMMKVNLKGGGVRVIVDASLLQSSDLSSQTRFIRSKGLVAKQLKWIEVGVTQEQENNIFKNAAGDTLQPSSYEYYEMGAFIQSVDSAKNRFGIHYKQRIDLAPIDNELNKSTTGESVGFNFGLLKNPNSKFNGSITYRKLKIDNTLLTANKPDESLLSRVEYRIRLFKGAITSSTFYELGSGLEAKRDFYYQGGLEPGQGLFVWNDRNGDGVEDKNEFDVARLNDGTHIKIFLPTDEYVKTYSNMFNEVLYFRPAVKWRNKKGMRKFVSRFSNQTTYRINRKNTNDDLALAYNPFLLETRDTTLVTLNSSFRNIFYINRTDPKFGVDLKYQQTRSKTLLLNGLDSRELMLRSVYVRWNMTRQFTLNVLYNNGRKINNSEFFSDRDYKILYNEVGPKVTYQPNTVLRLSILYNYKVKKNALKKLKTDYQGDTISYTGGEQAIHHKIGLAAKQNAVSKGSLSMNVNYINIEYLNEDETAALQNTSLGFEMLEGLQTGSNVTWTVSYQRNLSDHMQLSLTYDGRKSEDTPAVHRGGVQLRAFF